jgi:hypothetical protein
MLDQRTVNVKPTLEDAQHRKKEFEKIFWGCEELCDKGELGEEGWECGVRVGMNKKNYEGKTILFCTVPLPLLRSFQLFSVVLVCKPLPRALNPWPFIPCVYLQVVTL